MNKTSINVFKHDNQMYRKYNDCKLFLENNELIVFEINNSYVEQKGKPNYKINDKAYWFFPKNKWFNVIWYVESEKLKYYINIASPIINDNCSYKYIDYDLDYKVYNDYSYSIVDMKDFNKNRIKYKYNNDIVDEVWKSIDHVKKIIEEKEFIFDNEFQKKIIEEGNNG